MKSPPTRLIYVPIRLPQDMTTSISPDGTTETLTADFKEALQSLRDLASHPRTRCLLYGNKILKEIGRLENNLSGNRMVFGTNSLMYEQVPNNDPASKGINENELNAQLDPQASSDQITTQILTQTKADITLGRGQGAQDAAIPEALTTGAALVLILAAGSSRDPVDWRNIGYGCNLPVSRRRLQRDFNRAVLETKVGFFRTFTHTMQRNANSLGAATTRKLWAKGIVNPESKLPLEYLMNHHSAFHRLEVNQLDKDITEFGQSAAGATLTQIARYSPVLNQSTGLSNEGFICAFTHRITGSYRLLFGAGREMDDLALCPCLKRNGEPCSRPLNGYVHFIGCKSHGLHFYPHNRMEDTLHACYKDALRTRIIRGQAFACLNEDKRPRATGNLVTSIPRTLGRYNDEHAKFDEGNQADGLTIYGGHLPRDLFPINNSAQGPNPNQPSPNSLEKRKEAFHALLNICDERDLHAEHWDVHFCQGSYSQLLTNERAKGQKYAKAWNEFREDQGNAEALEILNRLNPANNGAPKIALFGMSLSGAFSRGGQDLLNRLAEIKFPTPLTGGSLSYIAARQRWMDWQMRICQRNVLNGVAKSIASGLRIFRAYLPTALPMDYAAEAAKIAPPTRYPHTPARLPALDSPDSASDTELQSGSERSGSQQPSIASTLVLTSSDEDTGNQSVASRTRFRRARQRTPDIAPPIEIITIDPPPTSQPTDNNPSTNFQDRQRAPKQQISRCLEDGTRIDLSLSEISDEEVDYGSYASNVDLDIASDSSWSAL